MRLRVPFVSIALLASVPLATAQEQKRPERMEGAGVIAPSSASSSTLVSSLRLPGLRPDGSSVLHNQWSLAPAGRHMELGDFPVHMVLHPNGKLAAVPHSGHVHSWRVDKDGLGLQPMSQFDAAALPMYASFSPKPDLAPYKAKPARVDLEAKNVAGAWGTDVSGSLDMATEDAADDLVLNEIVWKSVRGGDSAMPPPVRAAFVFGSSKPHDEDDDDDNDGRWRRSAR